MSNACSNACSNAWSNACLGFVKLNHPFGYIARWSAPVRCSKYTVRIFKAGVETFNCKKMIDGDDWRRPASFLTVLNAIFGEFIIKCSLGFHYIKQKFFPYVQCSSRNLIKTVTTPDKYLFSKSCQRLVNFFFMTLISKEMLSNVLIIKLNKIFSMSCFNIYSVKWK